MHLLTHLLPHFHIFQFNLEICNFAASFKFTQEIGKWAFQLKFLKRFLLKYFPNIMKRVTYMQMFIVSLLPYFVSWHSLGQCWIIWNLSKLTKMTELLHRRRPCPGCKNSNKQRLMWKSSFFIWHVDILTCAMFLLKYASTSKLFQWSLINVYPTSREKQFSCKGPLDP